MSFGRTISTVVSGNDHTLCISNENTVFSIGYSEDSAHGFTSKNSSSFDLSSPKMIPSLIHIKSVVSVHTHSVCLDNDGNVFTFGSNLFGLLGIGVDGESLKSTHIPQKINLPPCKQVSCGNEFTICLTEDGLVYSFGYNFYGQLGLGNDEIYNSPQLISSLKDVEFIECGSFFTFCKTFNNEIYCWGYNDYAPLGLENTDNQNIPILCSSLSNEDVVDIKCGSLHTLALTSSGDVLSCGYNLCGQLGRKTDDDYSSPFQKIEDLPEITRIKCGYDYSMCIDTNTDLYVFGDNFFGQLGLGDEDNRSEPIKHPSLSNIIDISKGGDNTFVKTSNNEIYAFGKNKYSQLGIKTKDKKQLTPIRVFEDNEDIWCSNFKSKAKSARSFSVTTNTSISSQEISNSDIQIETPQNYYYGCNIC